MDDKEAEDSEAEDDEVNGNDSEGKNFVTCSCHWKRGQRLKECLEYGSQNDLVLPLY